MDKQARENVIKHWWKNTSTPQKINTAFDTAAAPFAGYAVGSMLKNIIQGKFKNMPNAKAIRALHLAMGLILLGKGTASSVEAIIKKKK
jgi:hypothetical protein